VRGVGVGGRRPGKGGSEGTRGLRRGREGERDGFRDGVRDREKGWVGGKKRKAKRRERGVKTLLDRMSAG
jgi:hypothetical protein